MAERQGSAGGVADGPAADAQAPGGWDAEAQPAGKEGFGTLQPQGSACDSLKMSSDGDDDPELHRHGDWLSTFGQIVCAVVGAGVLSLSYSIAVLGWVAGIAVMVLFALATWYTSQLLTDVYVLDGRRMASYMDAVRTYMGPRHATILALVQYSNLWMTGIAYNITAASSMQAIACPSGASCHVDFWVFAVAFGGIQLFVSQLPNLDSLWQISALGTLMSFGYSIASMALSAYYMSEYGAAGGSVGGIPMSSSDKAFSVANAMASVVRFYVLLLVAPLGNIIFAYSFSMILIELADTIKSDKKGPVWHMRRAVSVSLVVITCFYLCVSVMGYAAFGNKVCEDIITCYGLAPDGSPSTVPSGVIQAVNVMVVVHLVPAYAVYTQPLFAFVEGSIAHSRRLNAWLPAALNPARRRSRWTFRLVFRSLYVAVAAAIAVALPFFSAIVGLVGALGFWPATVAYPVAMYIRKHRPTGRRLVLLRAVDLLCLAASIFAVIGSVRSLFPSETSYDALDDEVTPNDTYTAVMNR